MHLYTALFQLKARRSYDSSQSNREVHLCIRREIFVLWASFSRICLARYPVLLLMCISLSQVPAEYEASLSPIDQEVNVLTPEQMIAQVPVIEVDGDIAVCTGGDNVALGHPIEYIKLNNAYSDGPVVCK